VLHNRQFLEFRKHFGCLRWPARSQNHIISIRLSVRRKKNEQFKEMKIIARHRNSPSKLFVLSKMFCGLMSRWATFRRCKYSSARSTSRTQMRALFSVSDSFSSKVACNSPPAALEVEEKKEGKEIYELTFNAASCSMLSCARDRYLSLAFSQDPTINDSIIFSTCVKKYNISLHLEN
jgi:hypothetical protein